MDKFEGNFSHLNNLDASAIKEQVPALTATDWEAVSWRQATFEAHRDTQTIDLVFTKDFRYEPPAKREKYAELDCDELLAPVVGAISDYYTGVGYIVRALLVRLKARGVIPEHVDTGYSLMNARRIHSPITSTIRLYSRSAGNRVSCRKESCGKSIMRVRIAWRTWGTGDACTSSSTGFPLKSDQAPKQPHGDTASVSSDGHAILGAQLPRLPSLRARGLNRAGRMG